MRISLIGMSNIGKTYASKRIAATQGYKHIDCDALIEDKLQTELEPRGFKGIRGVARWMGFPFDPQYKETSARYIAREQEVMRETFALFDSEPDASVVLDTTGSVIYTGEEILRTLRAKTLIIYLEASPQHTAALFRRYTSRPKPVIWGESYAPETGEAAQDTLARCYPALLADRARRYKAIAHLTVPFDIHKNHKAQLLTLIAEKTSCS